MARRQAQRRGMGLINSQTIHSRRHAMLSATLMCRSCVRPKDKIAVHTRRCVDKAPYPHAIHSHGTAQNAIGNCAYC